MTDYHRRCSFVTALFGKTAVMLDYYDVNVAFNWLLNNV